MAITEQCRDTECEDKESRHFHVISPGYEREIRNGREIIREKLEDIVFTICAACQHWNQSGALIRCECIEPGCPCKFPSSSKA